MKATDPFNTEQPATDNLPEKRMWQKPTVEVISKDDVRSGYFPRGHEGQPTVFAAPPFTFYSQYHS